MAITYEELCLRRSSMTTNGKSCLICGENRYTEKCHVIPQCEGGRSEGTMDLCPNHHKFYDNGLLYPEEVAKLYKDVQEEYNKRFNPGAKAKALNPKGTVSEQLAKVNAETEAIIKATKERIEAEVKAENSVIILGPGTKKEG